MRRTTSVARGSERGHGEGRSVVVDAVVIGGGVIGSAITLELARCGLAVVTVDKAGAPGHGSTSASSAIVRFNFSTLDSVTAAWEAMHYWQDWEEHLAHQDEYGLVRYCRIGMLALDNPLVSRERVTQLFDQVGVRYEVWEAGDLQAHVSGVDTGRYWPPKSVDDDAFFEDAQGELGGIWMPDAGYVSDPQLAAHNLATSALFHGARYVFNRSVTAIGQKAGRVTGVTLSDGQVLAARIVVNAAGPWSGSINRLADASSDFAVEVRPMRQEVHRVAAPPGYRQALDRPGPVMADIDLGVYLRPDTGDSVLIGGTEPECDPREWIDDPDSANPNVTVPVFNAQVTRASRRLTGLQVPSRPAGVAGVYDVSSDWTPIYDRTSIDGFYVAMGTSGNQFKNAPLVGHLMATLIDRVEAGHDHDSRPVRHHCRYTGGVINLGSFSRKRSTTGGNNVMG